MKIHKIIISMILIMVLLVGNILINPVEAKTVEVKKNNSDVKLTITLLNKKFDNSLNEIAFKIQNKTSKEIRVTNISFQTKIKGEWKALQTRKKTAGKRNIIVDSKSKTYESINLKKTYGIPEEGIHNGEYSIYLKCEYENKVIYIRKSFSVKGVTLETPSVDGEVNNKEPQNSVNVVTKNPTIKTKLITTDFTINKSGKASAMVFSEADYKKAKKTKIYFSIQRKVNGKWKKFKSFKIVKKSNIAFVNKQIDLKKKGKYRMWIKISFYGKKKLRRQYIAKSKVQVF